MKTFLFAWLFAAVVISDVKAQADFGVTGKIDFVSDYIWRGAYQNSGFSVQPTLGLSYKNLSLTAWGSQSLTKKDGAQEFDLSLSYAMGRFSLAITDYWWEGILHPYGDYRNDHHFEAALSYTVSEKWPLTFAWATMFAGKDDNDGGNRTFSTYISAFYNFNCPAGIVLTFSVGFTPWKGMYDVKGPNVTDISLKANKELVFSDTFSLPVFVQAVAATAYDKAYLIGGVGMAF